MNIVVHSPDPLVFRDGRPWGANVPGTGGVLRWPLPSTMAGMVRTKIGLGRDPDYFERRRENHRENMERIKTIGLQRCLPVWRSATEPANWQYLFPAPADALMADVHPFRQPEDPVVLMAHEYTYSEPRRASEGINLPWNNWLVPISNTRKKPASKRPDFWREDLFLHWLQYNKLPRSHYEFDQLGFAAPEVETRMHTAIEPQTGTVKEHALFASMGIRLETTAREGGGGRPGGIMGCAMTLANLEPDDNPLGPCKLGGESRTAIIEKLDDEFPQCPDWFGDESYLRLVLITPGDFENWAPQWLLPNKEATETTWVEVPGTDIRVRLRSAFVSRWQAMSGWDYHLHQPKTTRKLVPAGSVYLVELQHSSRARELAKHLWGKSIGDNSETRDGFGCVCIGKSSIDHNKES